MSDSILDKAYFSSPLGWMEITGNVAGIKSVLFIEEAPGTNPLPPSLRECIRQFEDYFSGRLKQFTLPLAPEGTAFQLRTWNHLLKIPYGQTISYLELARRTGDAGAVRAVGHANGQNHINIIIPCHRVIGSNGKLTGYGGGLWRKKWLLKFEKSNQPEGLFSQFE
jgi:methylated-DNA-[protein]-cysteine S-methyltransferase